MKYFLTYSTKIFLALPGSVRIIVLSLFIAGASAQSSETKSVSKDWPQFRYDAQRTASTPHALPKKLHLQWERELPSPKPAWRHYAYNFDRGYEPIIYGKTLLLASNRNDCVTAYNTTDGKIKWRFVTNGPVRVAPVAYKNKVFVSSDDGNLYCLNIQDGTMIWKKPGFPYSYHKDIAGRKYFGNGRLISNWPLRGGILLLDGKIYYTAGLFQTEGVFMYCLDAETGKEIWMNDSVGSLVGFTGGSHGVKGAVLGHIPQGYLVQLEKDKTRYTLPGNRNGTRDFDFKTGQYLDYRQDSTRAWKKCKFGWAVQKDGWGYKNYPREIKAGNTTYDTKTLQGLGIKSRIWTGAAADDRLFLISLSHPRSGKWKVSCYGGSQSAKPKMWKHKSTPLKPINDSWTAKVKNIVTKAKISDNGIALVWGIGNGRVVEKLIQQTSLQVVAVDPDKSKVAALRDKLIAADVYGQRASVHVGNPVDWITPPYAARLILSADAKMLNVAGNKAITQKIFRALRPFGGSAWLPISSTDHETVVTSAETSEIKPDDIQKVSSFTVITRNGPLPGAMNFTKEQPPKTFDQLARPPFSVSWFGELPFPFASTYKHIRRPPGSPDVVDGIIVSKSETTADVYTGVLLKGKQKYSGRKDGWLSKVFEKDRHPLVKDPLFGFFRSYKRWKGGGCGGDFMGNLDVYRSGCAGFADVRRDTGTIHFAPSRPGCGRDVNMIAANGMFLFPMQYGCPCNVAMQAAFGFHSNPANEYWAYYAGERISKPLEAEPIKRIGINFGSIGDRNENKTLWVHQPRIGSHSFIGWMAYFDNPEKVKRYYHHSTRIKNSSGNNWVAASGVKGATVIRAPLSFAVYAHQTKTAPKIDAALNDACWDNRDPFNLWHEHMGPQQLNASIGKREIAPIFLRYDNKYLFIGGRTFEKDKGKGPIWRLFISDSERTKFGTIAEYLEFLITSDGKLTTNKCFAGREVKKEPINGDFSAAAVNKDDGFFVELSIPWDTLEAQKIDRHKLIFGSRGPNNVRNRYFSRYSRQFVQAQPVFLDGADRGIIGEQRPYTVRLTFAEPNKTANVGDRVFNVKLQGKTILTNFDIVKEAGGTRKIIEKEFKTVQAQEEMVLELVPVQGETLINGMEILGEYSINHAPEFTPKPNTKVITKLGKRNSVGFGFVSINLDPDKDPVTITWTLDGKIVKEMKNIYSNGGRKNPTGYHFVLPQNSNGRHNIKLKADDGKGGILEHTWSIELPTKSN